MKIVFFGTSGIGIPILEALNSAHEITAVVTAPDTKLGRKQILTQSDIAEVASKLNIPTLKPEKVKNNEAFLSQLSAIEADIFIVVSYGKILPLDIINMPKLKTLNVHFSLLPKYRGAAPVQFALLNGETSTGTTIFILDEHMDTGPILTQETINIEPVDTNETLQTKLGELSASCLLQILPLYESNSITPRVQDETNATYTTLIKKEDGLIDWQKSATQINNKRRAYTPWPGIYTKWDGKALKILNSSVSTEPSFSPTPGTVQNNLVQCGDGTVLEIITVQLEGKKPTSVQDFINGYSSFSKALLG